MYKILSGISKFLALIFAILFVISTVAALLLTTLEQQAFDPNLYKSALVEQDTYNRSPAILGEILATRAGTDSDTLASWFSINPCSQHPAICGIAWSYSRPRLETCLTSVLGQNAYKAVVSGSRSLEPVEFQSIQNECLVPFAALSSADSSASQEKLVSFLQVLKPSDWEAIIKMVLPPAELQAMTESFIDQAFSYWNGKTQAKSYSLINFKQRLTGQAGMDVIKQAISVQPACTPALLDQMNTGDGLTVCNLSEDQFNAIMPLIQQQLNSDVSQIPNGIEIPSIFPMLRTFLPWAPLLPLFFLLLITLAGVRSIKGWMRWWGIPVFFAGLITLGLGIALSPLLNWAWATYVVVRFPPYIPADLAGIGREIARYILLNLKEHTFLPAVVLTLVGLAAWVGSYFIKDRQAESKPLSPTL